MASGLPADPAIPGATPRTRLPHLSPAWVGRVRRVFAVLQAISPSLAARLAFRLFLRTFRRTATPEDRAALGRARRHCLHAGDDSFQVHEWGDGERRVIILHGWGASAARFTRMAETLQARGWHVLVPDAPGHGASPGRSSSLPQFIAALDAIVARFGPPRALIGHSLGALGIACRYAKGAPDWSAQLQGVVLISMPSGAEFLLQVFLDAMDLHATTRARLLALFERRFRSRFDAFASMPGASLIRAPLLIVHDEGDDIVPFAHSETLRQQLKAPYVIRTQGLGHSALTREDAVIRQIAEFLDGSV